MLQNMTIERVSFKFKAAEIYNDEVSTIIIFFGLLRITYWRQQNDIRNNDQEPIASHFRRNRD